MSLRIEPSRARDLVANQDALLVCAYEDSSKCEGVPIEDAISLEELRERGMPSSQQVIFY